VWKFLGPANPEDTSSPLVTSPTNNNGARSITYEGLAVALALEQSMGGGVFSKDGQGTFPV